MRILNLELKDFRSFHQSGRMVFSPNINIIVGKNDSGKSALLESFRRLLRSLANIGEADDDIYNDAERYEILTDVTLDSKNELYLAKNTYNAGDTLHVKCSHQRGVNSYKYEITQDAGSGYNEDHQEGFFESHRPNVPIFTFGSHRQLRGSSSVGLETFTNQNPDGSNAANIIDAIVSPVGKNRDEYESIMSNLLNYKVGTVLANGNAKVIGRENTFGKPIAASRMGSGISEVAYLVAHLVVNKKKVFVIDEIENSIHPQLLKQLLEVIREKSVTNNLQFIIGTHSNIVLTQLGSLGDSKVFRVSIEGDESSVHQITTPDERQNLLTELGYELSDLQLFDGFLLTEESSAQSFLEQIIIPKFFEQLRGKVKIVSSDGADDAPTRYGLLYKLFVFQFVSPAYKSKSWVLCDGDEKGKQVIADLKLKFGDVAGNFYNLEDGKQIEHYYPSDVVTAFLTEKSLATLDDLFKVEDKKTKREMKKDLLLRVLAKKDEKSEYFKKDAQKLIDIIGTIKL